jgi:ribonucleoside-diphosphate reductase alpha chain
MRGRIAKVIMTQRESPTSATLTTDLPSQGAADQHSGALRSGGLGQPVVVVKRNGMLVPFARERIVRAIELAFRDTKRLNREGPISAEMKQIVDHIAYLVVQELAQQAQHGMALTVEGIQDIVEIKLMQAGHLDVARDYIIYRSQHKAAREGSAQALKIQRREGEPPVRFNPIKIAAAIERAFRAASQAEGPSSPSLVDSVNSLTSAVVDSCMQAHSDGVALTTAMVQEWIERHLMQSGCYEVAKSYILSHSQSNLVATETVHAEAPATASVEPSHRYRAVGTSGEIFFDEAFVRRKITHAALGLPAIDIEEMVRQTVANFYDGMREEEVDQAYLMAARSKIEWDPDYSKFASRLLLDTLYRDLLGVSAHDASIQKRLLEYFKSYLHHGVSIERLDQKLLDFDLDRLANALVMERDGLFGYMGVQTLFDRYFIHENQRRLETPQIFWMRVAMGLALQEGDQKTEWAIRFYNTISSFDYCPATPTLFNSGTVHSQLSSCYLSTIKDDLAHIFKVIADDAQLSKWAGGIGNDWTPVRATGSVIKGTNGTSQGIIPFMKVANDTAVAVNQGGKRKGAMCAYLETWHLDVEDFLELRKNTGDERRRTHDMNTANWIPDLFMQRVLDGGSWTLFSPSDTADLHDLYGTAFQERYEAYERMTETGEIKLFKKVEALGLWRKMLSMLFETGHPWITFKDPSNLRSPQQHVGVVHSSNLCTEILLNTSPDETAVCNLGSINLVQHVGPNGLDLQKLERTVRTAIRMLDNVIDINFYPTKEAAASNCQHRPIGLGLMGFQDALYAQRIAYASMQAVEFADRSMEAISFFALMASSELAQERGTYASYKGSLWDQGILPIDSIELLAQHRGADQVQMDRSSSMPWDQVRESIRRHGMRNSNCMAIAPTATISNIIGVSQSIEPTYKNLYVKSNLSGEFTVPNSYLVNELKALGLWDADMIDDLKYFDGSLLEIPRIPDHLKELFLTSFEIEPDWLIECGSRRQKWLDMGQSLNLYMAEPSGKKLSDMYQYAWRKGLKTTYYLRTLAATQIEKSTTDINKRGLQPRWMKNKSASSNVQVQRDAPACTLGEACESCQ